MIWTQTNCDSVKTACIRLNYITLFISLMKREALGSFLGECAYVRDDLRRKKRMQHIEDFLKKANCAHTAPVFVRSYDVRENSTVAHSTVLGVSAL